MVAQLTDGQIEMIFFGFASILTIAFFIFMWNLRKAIKKDSEQI